MNYKFNIKDIIIIILVVLIVFLGFKFLKNRNLEQKYNQEVKLREALLDSIESYQLMDGSWASEKRTLQAEMKDLLKENSGLSNAQKAFIRKISGLENQLDNKEKIFAAAQIKYESLIDSLNTVIASATNIDTVNNFITFVENDSAAHFIYDLDIIGVRPYPLNTTPKISFNKIDFPNTQTITFSWDKNKRKDYPVSFTVINSNKFYRVNNIESYAIPEINKNEIDPNGFKRVWNWIKINGKYILVGAAGFGIGAAVSGN